MDTRQFERIISRHTFERKHDPILNIPDSSPLVALYVNQRPRRNPSLIYLIRPENLADWLFNHNGTPNLWLHSVNGPMVLYNYANESRTLLFGKYLLDSTSGPLDKDDVAKPVGWSEPKVDYFKTLWMRDLVDENGKPLKRRGQAKAYLQRSKRLNAALLDLRPEVWRPVPAEREVKRTVREQLKEYKSTRQPCTQRDLEAALVPPEKIVDEKCWAAYL